VASVGWLQGKGTLLVMPASNVCKGYHLHQPPKQGFHANLRCQQSVKQGYLFNPLLFGLYLDALQRHLKGRECNAPTLTYLHVWLLFFIDDLALMSESKVGLQQQLDMFQ
jgi:hypothetical protein